MPRSGSSPPEPGNSEVAPEMAKFPGLEWQIFLT